MTKKFLTEMRWLLFLRDLLVSSNHGNPICPIGFIDFRPASLVLRSPQMVDDKFGMILFTHINYISRA